MAGVLALVSFKIFPAHMGGQKGVALFYQYLSKHFNVVMAASRDNTDTQEASYEVMPLLYPNRRMLRNRQQLAPLRTLVEEKRINVLIAEHSYTAWLAWLLKRATGKPFIIHSHNLESYRFRQMNRKWWPLYWRHERWIHRRADHSFFISEEDLAIARREFGLPAEACSVIPYGIEEMKPIADARSKLRAVFNVHADHIFHFNGTLDYEPNIEAVENLLYRLDPLLQQSGLSYTILVSGKRLPQSIQDAIAASANIRYLDFVEDINLLYQGADLFLNPVTNDSGVKTKVIEALANHCAVVSSESGAAGIPPSLYGRKLRKAKNNDWSAFARCILDALQDPAGETPPAFFGYFSWTAIAARAAEKIQHLCNHHEPPA